MIGPTVRFRVLAKCNFRCAYCGVAAATTRLEIDHVVPQAQGGTDEEDNLTAACITCNRGKRDYLIDDIKAGKTRRGEPREKPPTRIVRKAPGFLPWLRKQTWRDDPVGDLARDLRHYDGGACVLPQTCQRHLLSEHFRFFGRHVSHAFYSAWREFNGSQITKDKLRNLRLSLFKSYGETYTTRGYKLRVDQ